MALNKLFNLFLSVDVVSGNPQVTPEISSLSKRLRYGNDITLREPSHGTTVAIYSFFPSPNKIEHAKNSEIVKYMFDKTSHVFGIPYVTLTAEISLGQ